MAQDLEFFFPQKYLSPGFPQGHINI